MYFIPKKANYILALSHKISSVKLAKKCPIPEPVSVNIYTGSKQKSRGKFLNFPRLFENKLSFEANRFFRRAGS
jgi:hypothetical protein